MHVPWSVCPGSSPKRFRAFKRKPVRFESYLYQMVIEQMKRFYSIKVKLVTLLVVILIFVFTINTYFVIEREFEILRKSLIESAKSFSILSSSSIIKNYKLYYDSGFYKYKEIIEDIMSLNSDLEGLQIVDMQGRIMFDSKELTEGKYSDILGPRMFKDDNIIERVRKSESSLKEVWIDNKRYIEIIQPHIDEWGRHDYSIRYLISFASMEQNIAGAIVYMITVNAASFLASIVLIYFFSHRFITGPIEKLTIGAEVLGKGKLETRVNIKSKDEIGRLASAFNEMASDLKKSRTELKEYSKSLEKKIAERTKELEKSKKDLESKIDELERFNKLSVGRELKMVELKRKVKELEEMLKKKGGEKG